MFHKFAVLIVMAIVAIAASGCAGMGGGPFSSLHYGGEGVLTGAAVGGVTSVAVTGGHPLWTAIGTIGGALVGGLIGGQISKGPGIQERDMALQAKQFALLQECRRDEWNRTEQAVRWSQSHGGKPADYYQPDYARCDRAYGAPPVVQTTQQSRNISQQPVTPQFNFPITVFAVNLPMTKVAVTPQSLAEAIAKNDQAVLNESAFDYLATMQKMHPEVGASSVNDLVEYLKNLELREFPQGKKFVFARVEKIRGQYDIKTFERMARPGERGLYDRNLGKFIASADCGNVVREPEVPVASKPAIIVVAQQPQLQPMPMFSQSSPVDFGAAYNDCPSGSSCGQAVELGKALIYGGSFIGGMAVFRPFVTPSPRLGPVNPNPPPGGGGPVNPNP
ncbi:MAG: hypothetical protein Q7K16_03080 [Candidatus Azambacteria bacterium]|nr:hypothetical protein [Candidatus Azambacteria bacterium]